MRWASHVALAAAVITCGVCAADPPKEPEGLGLTAPDGSEYANVRSRDVMQKKALSGNLIKNGSFERGRYWPANWDPVDGLGTFWLRDAASHGKSCIRFCTKLIETQWLPWNETVLAAEKAARRKTRGKPQSLPRNPLPKAPAPIFSKPPYYDSVGGLHGIHYRSDFIACKPGAIYRFRVDARSDGGTPKVFVKGFFDQKVRTDEGVKVLKRNAYKAQFPLDGCGKKWKRFAMEFHPARSKSTFDGKPLQSQWLRVELYAYWPVGDYDFDNVSIDITGHEEIAHKPTADPRPKPKPKPRELGEDEFPVF